MPVRALAVAPRFAAKAAVFEELGLFAEEFAMGEHVLGTRIAADPVPGATGAPGVWVAGNATGPADQVIGAAAAGVRAGAAINADLVDDEARRAAAERTAPSSSPSNRKDGTYGMSHQHGGTGGAGGAGEAGSAEEFWDGRYGERERIWSGQPNAVLVQEAADLAPGRALDLGSGEGADAIWLAHAGWQVTAVDISQVALDRAAGHAAQAGVPEGRISWQRHDLATSFPSGRYDLVSAHFLHSPVDMPREDILRSAAAAVAPGGVLLIVGHAGWPSWQQDPVDVHFPTSREVYESLRLPAADWEILRCDAYDQPTTDPDGNPATRPDTALKLHRRTP